MKLLNLNMRKTELTKDSVFTVTESKTLNLIIGIFFFVLVILSLSVKPHTRLRPLQEVYRIISF